MKRFKFRAYHNGAKEMLYENLTGDVFKWYHEHQDIEIMQFTGLKDKNGKEIYEGDIIQNVADDGRRLSKFEITWQQSCCGFVKEREDGNTFTLEISRFFEIIGNIYEHKHLLQ